MSKTIDCAAELIVHRPVDAALELFTAEGERAWAPGWDPTFPAPGRTEGGGAVFITAHGDQESTWVMVDQDEHGVRYSRVTPGLSAGTVTVAVLESDESHTRLRVQYDLTALGPEGDQWLEGFVEEFDDYIEHWEAAIAGLGGHDSRD